MKRVLPLIAGEEKVPSKKVLAKAGLKTTDKKALFRYLLVRLGFLPGYAMSERRMGRISQHLTKTMKPKRAFSELELMAKVCGAVPKQGEVEDVSDWKPHGVERRTKLPMGPGGTLLLSGVTPSNQKDI